MLNLEEKNDIRLDWKLALNTSNDQHILSNAKITISSNLVKKCHNMK